MLFALLTALSAYAQEPTSMLTISVKGMYGIQLDGAYLENTTGRTETWVNPGRHEVVVVKGFGKEVFRGFVDVPDDHEVRCRWVNPSFDCYESVALHTAPATVVVPVPTATTTTTTTTTVGGSVDGFGVSMSVSEDGMFVGVGGGFPGAPVIVTETTETTVIEQPAEIQYTVPSKVKLVLRSTDGEWADVYVDGKMVSEFRNESEKVVWISPGVHQVEVRDFMANSAYSRARIDTAYVDHLTIGIAEDQPMVCYDHDGFWAQ